ncbi:MAG: tripartite tricarboxylate transporter permease [Rhizobiaceae bacterium]|jgi:TctA family transporter
MDLVSNIATGLAAAATPANLLFCLVGCLLGTLVGVLPGIGPTATIALLLPITFHFDPAASLIMLAGIYYGSQYGGSTTSILVRLPGQPESVVTAIDGYEMARQGRGGVALATAAIGSFFAGTVATILIAAFAPLLTRIALSFGPADYFSLIVFALLVSVSIAQGSILKAVAMILLGLLLAMVGTNVTTGTQRYTFGMLDLYDGLDLIAVIMGLFGVAETISSIERYRVVPMMVAKVTSLLPNRRELTEMTPPIIRGTALGSFLGILPGGGALLASFASYSLEKRLSNNKAAFGHGAIAGVAGPESANNAAAQTSFIPMLTLGIPANAIMAIMASAMIMRGITPGPNVMAEQPVLFWGLIASMWIGNLMLLVLNLPLIGIWVRLVRIPYDLLYPAILVFCTIGVYSLSNSVFDIYVMLAFGVFGYILGKLGCEPAPLVLGMLLGPMLEEYLQRAMLLARGNPLVFVERPISAGLLAISLLIVAAAALPFIRRKRAEALQE